MMLDERRRRLIGLIRDQGFATVEGLANELAVSESTVRRDVEYLVEQGDVKRFHGGVMYSGAAPKLSHFEGRGTEQLARKQAIARRTVGLIEEEDTVLLDGGSTTFEVARLLVGRSIHVVTTSLPVANLFASDARADLVLIGGNVCPRTGVVQGPKAVEMLRSLSVRKTILSVEAIHDDGFFNNNLLLVETEQAMMNAADERVIVVADATKFGRKSLAPLCGLGEVGSLVVDDGISEEWRDKVVAAGVELLVAEL